MQIAILLTCAYLLGSIPFGLMVGRWLRGVDIRKFGSGNIGFTNVLRVLGPGPALLVLVGDTLKGVIPVVTGDRLLVAWGVPRSELWVLAVALAAILGHSFSVFCGFRGGRAIATALGTLLVLCWPSALIGLGIWLLLVALTRYISLSSMVAALSVPAYMAVAHMPSSWIAFWSAVALLIVVRHSPNIKRLISGTETRIGQKVDDGTT